jgi:integrase/recombinase XerD
MPATRRPLKSQKIDWPDALERYLTHLRATRFARRTVDGVGERLANLRRVLEPRCPLLADVTLDDLRGHQASLFTGESTASGRPLSARAAANHASTVRAFFRFLADDELVPLDPAARLEQPRCPPRRAGEALTVDEVTRLLTLARDGATTPTGQRDHALVELLYATGLRRNEALHLELGDVDRRARDVVVRHGKGDKHRRVPLTRSAYHVLAAYLDEGRRALTTSHPDSVAHVFLSVRGRRLDHMALARLLRGFVAGAGIERRVSPHTLRRSFATHLLQGGASLRAIQLLLGHEALSTTAFYLDVDPRELRREVLSKHPRERLDL